MFYFRRSYGNNWRVFVPHDAHAAIESLKKVAMWGGGPDKSEHIDDETFLGFEFHSFDEAVKAAKEAFAIK